MTTTTTAAERRQHGFLSVQVGHRRVAVALGRRAGGGVVGGCGCENFIIVRERSTIVVAIEYSQLAAKRGKREGGTPTGGTGQSSLV
jgi:hypothetical protein